mgnify:CR=1 FL=1
MLVKLTDPTKIVWDSTTGVVITGKGTFDVPFSSFIRLKLLEGSLEEIRNEEKPQKTDNKGDIDSLNMAELRKLASEKGINSFGMKKVDLIEALKGV